MGREVEVIQEKSRALYPFQEEAIRRIFDRVENSEKKENILFQLPTGGGKTVIFSEIAKRYLLKEGKKVLILTHRVELSEQTSRALEHIGVKNKIINRDVKELHDKDEYDCYVAMVETLNNRLNEDEEYLGNIGLVVIDEAHYNSFRKLFRYFQSSIMLGVTATPLSSNRNLPLNENYDRLIVGDSIARLIEKGYLSDAKTYTFNVNLRSLKVGPDGDYTVSSLDRLYSLYNMQDKLLGAYYERAKGTKTLIFNSGISTSIRVYELFKTEGLPIRHLDSTFSPKDRQETLDWFRENDDAILTSVGILTTGFDEPGVETIILNRATRSLTLYHQMIGRGSRVTPNKKRFSIIDLGNNVQRLGLWQDFINWQDIFKYPDKYFDRIESREQEAMFDYKYERPKRLQERFANNDESDDFNMREVYKFVVEFGDKPKKAVNKSLKNHAKQIEKNADDYDEAIELMNMLEDEIEYRLRLYCNCLQKATENYFQWLKDTYMRKLRNEIRQEFLF